ncbi:erythromycin esterase family protein [Sphaerisporangium rubeum]|uniref:Erythromycin esterase-like protein n=1 Tax=Sphaerisporangium rubeum TaxID=321317 RepID=A0A7X0M884_9ACTN|nr:erythromycin esterase family protein [Sphaerisporangium rubeum]MBB6475563.1 erythromycin esterase-like protein [Sphaerisporangium rubeum]
MPEHLFHDRRDAGRGLAALLGAYRGRRDVVVLAMPPGGAAVAAEIAEALHAPLDVLVVRELGVPGQEDLVMGAVAAGGLITLNDDVIRGLSVEPEVVEHVAAREGREVRRFERHYRRGRPPRPVEGGVAILADDGLGTGARLRAAVQALRRLGPARLVVALPAACEPSVRELSAEADEVVCAVGPAAFLAPERCYRRAAGTGAAEVREMLDRRAAGRSVGRAPGDEAVAVEPLAGRARTEALLDLVGDARLVLVGAASHGTHEFHAARVELTRALIEEKGFAAVALLADWPDACRADRYVRGAGGDADAEEALRGFRRFPAWAWRNTEVLDFVEWLRRHNDGLAPGVPATGLYGLDLYALHRTATEIVAALDATDPPAAARARARLARGHLGCGCGEAGDPVFDAACGAGERREAEMVTRLAWLRRETLRRAREQGLPAEDELFYGEHVARVVETDGEYDRALFRGHVSSWNVRTRHMAGTLDALLDHLDRRLDRPARIVVWGTIPHLGDACATEAACRGELSVGRLVRERHPGAARLLGLTTYSGTVTAAPRFGAPPAAVRPEPAVPGSVEALLHETGAKDFLVTFPGEGPLDVSRPERVLPDVIPPDGLAGGHVRARIGGQFDAVVHFDETHAVRPLDLAAAFTR